MAGNGRSSGGYGGAGGGGYYMGWQIEASPFSPSLERWDAKMLLVDRRKEVVVADVAGALAGAIRSPLQMLR